MKAGMVIPEEDPAAGTDDDNDDMDDEEGEEEEPMEEDREEEVAALIDPAPDPAPGLEQNTSHKPAEVPLCQESLSLGALVEVAPSLKRMRRMNTATSVQDSVGEASTSALAIEDAKQITGAQQESKDQGVLETPEKPLTKETQEKALTHETQEKALTNETQEKALTDETQENTLGLTDETQEKAPKRKFRAGHWVNIAHWQHIDYRISHACCNFQPLQVMSTVILALDLRLTAQRPLKPWKLEAPDLVPNLHIGL